MLTRNYSRVVVTVAVILLFLVPLLAYLQFLWLGELSERELDRMRNNLRVSGLHIAFDVNEELATLVRTFGGRLTGPADSAAAELTDRLKRWEGASSHTHIVGEIYYVSAGAGARDRVVRKLNRSTGRFDEAAAVPDSAGWSADLMDADTWMHSEAEPGSPLFIRRTLAGFAMPLWSSARRETPEEQGAPRPPDPRRAGIPEWRLVPEWPRVLVTVRWDTLERTLIPALIKADLSASGTGEYDLVAVSRRDSARVLFSSPPGLRSADVAAPDAEIPFGYLPRFLLPGRMRAGSFMIPETVPAGGASAGLSTPPPFFESGSEGPRRDEQRAGANRAEAYTLRIRHHAAPLEAVVGQIRVRNIAISLGIILVLTGSVIILLRSAHRAQRLALQELEFVAGVSHELRTPLAVVNSVGDNLAHGVVAGADRVREYGRLITSEVGRLSAIVDNALEYTGLQSGRRTYDMQVTDLAVLVAGVLRECDGMITQAGVAVERCVEAASLPVRGDAQALRIAVRNILVNAVKFGRDGGWLRIDLRTEPADGAVRAVLAVTDRGIGIEPADRKRIFSPFYRGRNALQVQGSGLGLSLARHIVAAHGGRIDVESSPGNGSTFTIRLPLTTAGTPQEGNAG